MFNQARKCIYMDYVLVTVETAKEWLKKNIKNRPLSKHTLRAYIKEMAQGKWIGDNGETIKFNRNGDLLDGQHRLQAIVEVGRPQWCCVCFNVNDLAFTTIDYGKRRSGADILGIIGFESACESAAIATMLYRHYKGGFPTGGITPPTNQELCDFIDDIPDLDKSVTFCESKRTPRGFLPRSIIGFLHYVIKPEMKGLFSIFVDRFISGENCRKGQAEYHLHDRLVSNKDAKARLNKTELLALVIKGWNAYAIGKSVSFLRWTEGEPFPSIMHSSE